MHTLCPQTPKEGITVLGTGVQVVLSHHVGAGSQTPVFFKNSECSYPPAIFPAPKGSFFSEEPFLLLENFCIHSLTNPGRSGSIKCPIFMRELACSGVASPEDFVASAELAGGL